MEAHTCDGGTSWRTQEQLRSDALLSVRDVKVHFDLGGQVVRAVDGVSLDLPQGRTLGLVGESGCGKSVLTRSIMRLSMPSHTKMSGTVVFDGQELSAYRARQLRDLWGRDIALITQNPLSALNPVMKIGRQLTEHVRHHMGTSRSEAVATAMSLLSDVRIPEPRRCFHSYPHQLSGGMRQRVCIAMAIACGAKLLLADEPTTALDVTVQHEILNLLGQQRHDRGMAMILVTHDLGVVAGRTDEMAVMYAGRIVERATTPVLFEHPRHPYTASLLASIPRLGDARGRLATIEGRPPPLGQPAIGCSFVDRCPAARDRCREESPVLQDIGGGHEVACWYPLAPSITGSPTAAAAHGPALSPARA